MKLKSLLLLKLSLLSVSFHGFAAPLVVGVEDFKALPYWHYDPEKKLFSGFTRDFFDAFGLAYDYQITYRPLPIKRLYAELYNGKIDLKFPDNPKWGKNFKGAQEPLYSAEIVPFTDGLMTKPEKNIHRKEDLHSINAIRGMTPYLYYDDIVNNKITLLETSQLESAIRMTLADRSDAVYGNIDTILWQLNTQLHQPNSIQFNTQLPHVNDFYHASTLKNNKVIQDLNAFILANPIMIQSIKEKYHIQTRESQL